MANKGTALVTGASSGIGLEIARALAKEGFSLVLVARRKAELEKLAKECGDARVLVADLTKSEAPEEIFAWCEKEKIVVDVLVNNAGFGANGKFHEIDAKREVEMVTVNCASLVHLTSLFVKPMLARKRGRILNVGSVAGFQPGPYMAVYYATKAFVNSFSEAISAEYSGTGITVTVLCPGPTISGFVDAAKMEGTTMFRVLSVADSRSVAVAGVRGMLKGKTMVVPGLLNKVGVQSNRLAPRGLVRALTKRLNSRKGQ